LHLAHQRHSSGGSLSIGAVGVYQTTRHAAHRADHAAVPSGPSVVSVSGTQGNWHLVVNGAPYQIKGLTFGPPSAAALAYMPELKAMGVNTLRTWGPMAPRCRYSMRLRPTA